MFSEEVRIFILFFWSSKFFWASRLILFTWPWARYKSWYFNKAEKVKNLFPWRNSQNKKGSTHFCVSSSAGLSSTLKNPLYQAVGVETVKIPIQWNSVYRAHNQMIYHCYMLKTEPINNELHSTTFRHQFYHSNVFSCSSWTFDSMFVCFESIIYLKRWEATLKTSCFACSLTLHCMSDD